MDPVSNTLGCQLQKRALGAFYALTEMLVATFSREVDK